MQAVQRLRYKIFTSFAVAVLAAVTFVRLVLEIPLSMHTLGAFVVAAILCLAGAYRGILYTRASRALTSR